MSTPRVAVTPELPAHLAAAVREGGGRLVDLPSADAVVWTASSDPDGLRGALQQHPEVRWVQLPFAGVEAFVDLIDSERVWTAAQGAYARPVAEHALALALAGLRSLTLRARARSWGEPGASTLYDAPVTVLGAGGITAELLRLLAPFRAQVTVVRRAAGRPVDGAVRTVGLDELDLVLPGARVVVLALALTPDTRHVLGAGQLARMADDAWLVNVARGAHVDTAALVAALRAGRIGGAALDVTDPEPLPDDSPLWSLPNALVTPHTANPPELAAPLLAERVRENVRRRAAGEQLLGLVDAEAGY